MKTRLPKQIGGLFRIDSKQNGLGHRNLPYIVLAGLMFLLMLAVGCQAPNAGLIGNMQADQVTAFDADAIALRGDKSIPRSVHAEHYSMAINPLGHRGYVSDELSPTIHVVSLENLSQPKVQKRFNATHSASLLATSQGGQALMLATTGMDGRQGVVSTINTVNGNEIDRIGLGQDVKPMAITVCDDDKTLLVAVDVPHEVRKFTIANDGSLADTGKSYPLKHGTRAADVLCPPGSKTGVVVIGHGGAAGGSGSHTYAESFDVSSMSRIETQRLASRIGVSAAFSPNGQTFYVRSDEGSYFGQSYIEAFSFDPQNGQFGSVTNATAPPVESEFLRDSSTLAIDENGDHLFVTDRWNDQVLVLDAGTLTKVQTLSGNLSQPISITIGGSGAP